MQIPWEKPSTRLLKFPGKSLREKPATRVKPGHKRPSAVGWYLDTRGQARLICTLNANHPPSLLPSRLNDAWISAREYCLPRKPSVGSMNATAGCSHLAMPNLHRLPWIGLRFEHQSLLFIEKWCVYVRDGASYSDNGKGGDCNCNECIRVGSLVCLVCTVR